MIRLLSVIGHGIELLPHFINHYRDEVDEINLIVYSSEVYPNIEDDIRIIIKSEPKVKIIHSETWRKYDWAHVTFLYNKFKFEFMEDWWVIADIDEFHINKKPIYELINDCVINGWEFVTGGFLDRAGFNGELSELTDTASIWKQFPYVGFFRYPVSEACPNKVTICKGKIEISSGQHYVKIDGQTTWKWQGWNHPLRYPTNENFTQVHHFKWDSTIRRRIKDVASLNATYAYSTEYLKMYNYLKENNFLIDITNKDFMFEYIPILPDYVHYGKWKLITNKIISI